VTDDLSDPWYPAIKRFFLILFTSFVMVLLILLALAIAGALMFLRYVFAAYVWNLSANIAWAVIITAVLQAIAIVVYDYFAKKVIYLLT